MFWWVVLISLIVLFFIGSLSPKKPKRTKKRQPPKARKKNNKNILKDLCWSHASRALFAGLKNKADVLSEFQKRIMQVVNGKGTAQQARGWLREFLTTDGKEVLRELGFAFEESEMNQKDNLTELGSVSRLKLIIEQNVSNIQAAEEYDHLFETKDFYPYAEYRSGQDCNHHNLNGKIYRVGSSEMRAVYPPNDHDCSCRMRPLRRDELKGRKIEKKAPSNKELSPSGFVFDPAERPIILRLYPNN